MYNPDKMMATLVKAFGEPVTYKPFGQTPLMISAIRSIGFVENSLDGHGFGPQRVTFRIASAGIPRPGSRDVITDAQNVSWFVDEVPQFAFEGQWELGVNTSPPGRRS